MHPPASACRAALALLIAVAAVGACGDEGSGNEEAFCATARRFEVDNPAAALSAVDVTDPAATARALRDAADDLGPWVQEAPSEVRGDIELVRDAAVDLAETFEAPTLDPARVAELEAGFPDVEAAAERLVEAVNERCDVDLDPTAAPPTTSG